MDLKEMISEELKTPPPGINFKDEHMLIDDRFEDWVVRIVTKAISLTDAHAVRELRNANKGIARLKKGLQKFRELNVDDTWDGVDRKLAGKCPHCGGDAVLRRDLRNGYENSRKDKDAWAYYAFCVSCAAQGGWAKTTGNAVRNWEMRAT